jgi:DNA-binding IclR family transcriptional regulator
VLTILLALAEARKPMSFAELHRRLGWPKGSLHALLKTLEGQRFLLLDPDSSRYSVGIAAFEVGSAYPAHADVRYAATPVLEELVRGVDETCHVAVLDRGQVVYIDRIESTQEVRFVAAIGRRLPAYTTGVGKALLAELSDRQVAALYPPRLPALTANTLTTRDKLIEELGRVRAAGYALDDQESTPGVRCVAVALTFDFNTRRSAAFSLSIPLQRAPLERLHALAPRLQRAAAEIRARVSRCQPDADLGSWNLGLPRT